MKLQEGEEWWWEEVWVGGGIMLGSGWPTRGYKDDPLYIGWLDGADDMEDVRYIRESYVELDLFL